MLLYKLFNSWLKFRGKYISINKFEHIDIFNFVKFNDSYISYCVFLSYDIFDIFSYIIIIKLIFFSIL